jgi:hypothetical protein
VSPELGKGFQSSRVILEDDVFRAILPQLSNNEGQHQPKEILKMFRPRPFLILTIVLVAVALSSFLIPTLADGGANHRVRNQNFGVSGGNVNDITRRFCCSGTLGSLVTFGGVQYVLSNNHVLARADQAAAGEDVSQPGLIDSNCQVATVVADFSAAPPLGPSNVDAAVAQLRPGTMDSTGEIEDIGIPSSTIATATVGMSVAKSGRTTGFTTGNVGAVNTSVSVQYQKNCGQGKKFVISYTNQVVINSSSFSAGGDSGSLILTNDGTRRPVALLFAGSSTSNIGNPIGEVLTRVGAALGGPVTFGGVAGGGRGNVTLGESLGPRPLIPSVGGQMRELPQQAADRVAAVLELHRDSLMSRASVIGVGIGLSDDNDTEGAIVVYVDKTTGQRPILPNSIDGTRLRIVLTDPFIAL